MDNDTEEPQLADGEVISETLLDAVILIRAWAKRVGPGKTMVLDGSDDKWYDRRDDKFIDLLDPKLGYYSQLHIPIVKAKIADKDSVLTFDTVSEGHIQVPGGEDIDLGPTSIVDGLYVGKLEDMSPEVFAMHFKRKTCARNASAEFLAIASRHLWPYYRVERNARRLLRSLLNPEQRRVYNDFGFFFVHKDDRIYKVHGYMGVQLVESKHVNYVDGEWTINESRILKHYCLHNVDDDMPQADVLITQKMLLDGAEDHFLEIANTDLREAHADYDAQQDIRNLPAEEYSRILLERNGGRTHDYTIRRTLFSGEVLVPDYTEGIRVMI